MNTPEKVFLWTRQDRRMLEDLKRQGIFYVKREYIEAKNEDLTAYFLRLYDWFVQAASKKVPQPEHRGYPIWCSVSEDYMLREAAGNVLLKLAVDKERIVYFDSARWDMVLNHMYISENEADRKRFDTLLKSRGIRNSFSLMDDSHRKFYPDLAERVVQSWERIFEIREWNIFYVQANIWEIRPEDIVSIEMPKE